MITRYFNSLKVDSELIYKKSENLQKLRDEFTWFSVLSKDLFFEKLWKYLPEDISFRKDTLSMKYYTQGDLGEFYLDTLNIKSIQNLIDLCLQVVLDFSIFDSEIVHDKFQQEYPNTYYMYVENLKKRMYSFPEYLRYKTFIINENEYSNFLDFNFIESCYKRYAQGKASVIHGDLILSNILKTSSGIKLIDPRGSFGNGPSILGDAYYDISKLRSSFVGSHEFVIHNRFTFSQQEENIIRYETNQPEFIQNQVQNYFDKRVMELGFDLEKVIFLEGLLTLSKIPFHIENPQHCKIFYGIALQRFSFLNVKR